MLSSPHQFDLTSSVVIGPLSDRGADQVELGELQVLGDGDLPSAVGPLVQHIALCVTNCPAQQRGQGHTDAERCSEIWTPELWMDNS